MLRLAMSLVALVSPVFVTCQCNYDQKCWFASIGCTLANGNPFERRAFISCDECLDLCLKRKDGPPPYCCKSVVYDSQWKFCDLFAIKANSQADFVKYPGRVYLSPSGNCSTPGSTPGPEPGKNIVDCPAGQKAVLSIFQNATNPELPGSTPIAADSSEKCGLLCVQNKDDKGNPFQCQVAAFSQGRCVFSSKAPADSTAKNLKPGADPTDLYLEKKCYPQDQAGACSAIVLDPHHLIVGYNRKTVDAASYEQCLQECLNAKQQFQFTCNSGQFYADITTDNCILNEETRETKPAVYLATDDNNIYFEPQCADGRRLIYSMKRSKARLSLRDAGMQNLDQVRWSDWSDCNKTTNMKHRFENCVQKRHQMCKMQEAPCDFAEKFSELEKKKMVGDFPCEPIIVHGKPNCKSGIMTDPITGTREYGCKPNTANCWSNELIFI